MLGQVVVNHQYVFALFHPCLSDGTAGIGGEILQGSRIAGSGNHYGGIGHCSGFRQQIDNACHGGCLLSDGYINAQHPRILLVQYRIYADGCLPGLTVSDNQFPLAPTDGYHGINGTDACLQGNIHLFAHNHTGCHVLHIAVIISGKGPFVINRLPKGIDHTSKHGISHRDLSHSAGSPDRIPGLYACIGSQKHRPDAVLIQVQGHAVYPAGELQQLPAHCVLQSVNMGNPVSDFHDTARL